MKANQKFVTADEAVSPVIGVILMVAITVVLAAVVFVLVSDLGDSGESAPQMSFDADDSANTVTVIKAPTGLDWSEFAVTCTTSTPTGDSGSIEAGDQLGGCADDETMTIRHIATNSLLYTHTFA